MAKVNFTSALRRFFPGLSEMQVGATTVADLVAEIEAVHPGIAAYIIDEHGALRKHVNIFLNGSLIKDKTGLSDVIADGDEVYIMQALSGG